MIDVEVGDGDPYVGFGWGGIPGRFDRIPGFGVGFLMLVASGVVLLKGNTEFVTAAVDDVKVVVRIWSQVLAGPTQADIKIV